MSRTLMWVSAAVVVTAVLLAPALTTGECVDAVEPGASYCQTQVRSLVAIPTHWAIWLGATVVAVGYAWWRSLRPPRRR